MDLDITQEEYQRIEKAMKDEKFVKLLNEYMDEISDPKNKEEYEAYLKQLEGAGDLPPGRVLLHPSPGFCIKTSTRTKTKCFINICQSDQIATPEVSRNGKGGNWQLPYAMGHPRHDRDKSGSVCFTSDCAFNPKAFLLANNSVQFLNLMCDTAIDGANQTFKSQGEKLSKDYKLLKKLKCKGTKPGAIMVATSRLQNPSEPPAPQNNLKLSQEAPKLYKELISSQMKMKESQEPPKTEETPQEEPQRVQEETLESKGIAAPKYKLVYTQPVDLGEFLDTRQKTHKRPKEAMVTISVPRLSKIQDATIDFKDKLLIFEVPKVYYLEVKLSYEVDEENSSAKFDKTKKEIKVTLPVVQMPETYQEIITSQDEPEFVDEEKEKEYYQKENSAQEKYFCETSQELIQEVEQNPIQETEQEPTQEVEQDQQEPTQETQHETIQEVKPAPQPQLKPSCVKLTSQLIFKLL